MSQRNVELFIGRLLTDDDWRQQFLKLPDETIACFRAQGFELTPGEIDALSEVDVRLWSLAAHGLPSRLQRCSLLPNKPRNPAR